MNNLQNRFDKIIKNDFGFFLVLFILIFLIWSYVLGVPLTNLFGTGDTLGLVGHYADMLRLGPLATEFTYSSTRLGGSNVGAIDMPVYYQFFSLLGLHPMLAINASIILTQSLIAFFSLRIIKSINSEFELPSILELTSSLLFAFNPALGWRISFGHLNMAWGLLWGLAIVFLYLSLNHKKLSFTGALLAFFVLGNSLQCINLLQPLVYTIIVILISSAVFFKQLEFRKATIASFGLITVAAFVWAIFNLQAILEFIPTLSRSSSQNLIYSYNTETFKDFISSFFYFYETMSADREFFLLHETNLGYGIAPVVAIVLGIYFKNLRMTILCLSTFIFGIVLSANIPVVSDLLLTVIPILKTFRCPSRIFFFLTYLYLIVIVVIFKNQFLIKNRIFLGSFALSLIGSILLKDLFIYMVMGILISLVFNKKITPYVSSLSLGFFIAINVAGFKDKIVNDTISLDQYTQVRESMARTGVSTNLLEHYSTSIYTHFAYNQGAVYGYATVDGYIYPTRRFLEVARYITPNLPDTSYAFEVNTAKRGFFLYKNLFNITDEYQIKDQQLIKSKIQDSVPFYSPEKVSTAKNVAESMQLILTNKEKSIATIEESSDGIDTCDEVSLLAQSEKTISFKVKESNKCLLVLPTQYSERIKLSEETSQVRIIPANWLTTGVLIHNYEGEIHLTTQGNQTTELIYKALALFLVIATAAFINFKLWKREN